MSLGLSVVAAASVSSCDFAEPRPARGGPCARSDDVGVSELGLLERQRAARPCCSRCRARARAPASPCRPTATLRMSNLCAAEDLKIRAIGGSAD